MNRIVHILLTVTIALLGIDVARASDGCPLDHFAIGQLQGEGAQTGSLFADVDEMYTIHTEKPCAACYPLNYSWYYDAYVNGEPGTALIENDPKHELVGTPIVDYDIWLEVVELSDGFYVGAEGTWYGEGEWIHLSSEPSHHLHIDYFMYAADWAEDKLVYVVYRLIDDLDDGLQYDPSEEFWVVFNRPVPGDFDSDGHIDQDDYKHFHAAVLGPDTLQEDPAYENADFDGDGDVDLEDFSRFQACYSGPDEHPDPRCAE